MSFTREQADGVVKGSIGDDPVSFKNLLIEVPASAVSAPRSEAARSNTNSGSSTDSSSDDEENPAGTFLIEPVNFTFAQQKNTAQDQRGHPIRMCLRVGQREG